MSAAADDRALIKLAFERGRDFCEENVTRWRRNEWDTPEETRHAQQEHWRANAQRMKELSNELRSTK